MRMYTSRQRLFGHRSCAKELRAMLHSLIFSLLKVETRVLQREERETRRVLKFPIFRWKTSELLQDLSGSTLLACYVPQADLATRDVPSFETSQLCALWHFFLGEFPSKGDDADGYRFAAPVNSFKPNGFGLYTMAGAIRFH